ncbi:hypothetical protein AZH53_08500 [Methanomicrobiaceae archaeon CYW5]|uniref:methytransferase partner Trm112 n=1 Tax=Methanovulcanius yangii TaxID=1789227 RepID=UPI0029C9EEF7|nr:methytransferase partner Trm112 [Methanovulcanius yangii]MBT8508443.1 hypothetical protein [Methanovulcanius yangii]
MRISTMKILCCPVCCGGFTLTVTEQAVLEDGEEDIVEGTLICTACGAEYPVREGIPNLLPPGSECGDE